MEHDDFLKELEESNKRLANLLKELTVAPEVIVEGLIRPSGVGLSQSMGQTKWQLSVELCPWRCGDGHLRHEKLFVRQEIADEESSGAREGMDACTVVALRVRLAEVTSFGGPQALLVAKLLQPVTDQQLHNAAEELQLPKTYVDAQFGEFTLDRRVGWYQGRTHWGAEELVLNLRTQTDDDDTFPSPALEHARELWHRREEWSRKADDKIAEELLELKNDVWLHEDESPLTRDVFLQTLTIEAITMDCGGEFSMWFGDGDLFGGHSIEAWGSIRDGIKRADLQG